MSAVSMASCRDCAAGRGRRGTLCRRSCQRTGDQLALFSKIPIRAVLFHLAIEGSKIAASAISLASMLAVSCRSPKFSYFDIQAKGALGSFTIFKAQL